MCTVKYVDGPLAPLTWTVPHNDVMPYVKDSIVLVGGTYFYRVLCDDYHYYQLEYVGESVPDHIVVGVPSSVSMPDVGIKRANYVRVARLISLGATHAEIAQLVNVPYAVVDDQVNSLMRRMKVRTPAQMVREAIRTKLIRIDDDLSSGEAYRLEDLRADHDEEIAASENHNAVSEDMLEAVMD